MIAKVRFWATQSREPARHYEHKELGYNYRMSNIVAGIGRGQLKVLDQRVEKKRYIFDFYKSELAELEGLEIMPSNKWDELNYWLSSIQLTGKISPSDVMDTLEEEDIESRPVWKPMHLQLFFEQYDFICSGVSEKIYENVVFLSSETKMTDDDLNRVIKT